MKKHEKYEKILSWINRNEWINQRVLSESVDMSLGSVNQVLKKLIDEGYLERESSSFILTMKGEQYLSLCYKERQGKKLIANSTVPKIKKAVILAAGDNHCFDVPEGLLSISSTTIMDRILMILKKYGIEEICMVVGAKKEQYLDYYCSSAIVFITNPKYKWTGTMYSLALAKEFIDEDFLLIESNQIFEDTAIDIILKEKAANGLLLTVPSGSKDEAYVELDQENTVFRISKDIRQLNHIDGEAIGISKISKKMFEKMLEYYEKNTNPWLNYEYVLEGIGRTYGVQGIVVNDLVWRVIENEEHYRQVCDRVYPEIIKRETLTKENDARQMVKDCLHLTDSEVGKVRIGGGMTNSNYFVDIRGEVFILRIPGACTDEMVDRRNEEYNSELAAKLQINPESIYFDSQTGIKITKCIEGAVTFNGKTARLENNIRKTTTIMRTLHQSHAVLKGEFSVLREYEKYKQMILQRGISCYQGFDQMDRMFYILMDRLKVLGVEYKPCHNDLVAENFVMDKQGKLYLIDWEYSGNNDPMWDVASHLLECEFTDEEEELFLSYYFQKEIKEPYLEKIMIYKISQDILWSAWTILKEYDGENFGTYGTDRLNRAIRMVKEYNRRYGRKE